MPDNIIKQVKAQGINHDFVDTVSGYGSFSATPTLTSADGERVATISYRTFNPSLGAFGATTTVDFYAPEISFGNGWVAGVDGTNLILSSQGTPIVNSLGTMPDITSYTSYMSVLDSFSNAGLMTKTVSQETHGQISIDQYEYTANCPVNMTYWTGTSKTGYSSTTISLDVGETYTVSSMELFSDATTTFSQSPAAGTVMYVDTQITASQASPSGGGGLVS